VNGQKIKEGKKESRKTGWTDLYGALAIRGPAIGGGNIILQERKETNQPGQEGA